MNYRGEFLANFMIHIEFPKKAQDIFMQLYKRIQGDVDYSKQLCTLSDLFMNREYEKAFEGIDLLASDMEEHSHTMSMLLLLLCADPLFNLYQKRGLSESLYWDTMKDLTYKLNECHQVYGIWGVFVRNWYPGFYELSRFALGRMQYEYSEFELDHFEWNGIRVTKGDKVINMHIPSCGSFTEDIRLDSYKKAYEFYKKDFGDKPIPMVCSSWLLFPEHRKILSEDSNIRGFMNDFSYIVGELDDKFEDGWRVFGSDFMKAPKDWPRKTTLQKAYGDHIDMGGKTGSGYGVFFFDGEKILR